MDVYRFNGVFSDAKGAKKAEAFKGVKAAFADRQTTRWNEERRRSRTSISVARQGEDAGFDARRIENPAGRPVVSICDHSAEETDRE